MRIVIAEDAVIMRDGLSAILTRRGHDVVAAVGGAEALLKAVCEYRPDVAVIDVRMPPTHTDELFITLKVVEKHVANIFDKLGLAPSDSDNRRVLAAIRYLQP